ncbi:PLD-like domain-containing protein [Marinobacter daqiaonensis]|uniref:PLD-like domain-containing protein n=1 Tax=Marinobacter daqiaonensis TaxID=650891 RepID=A0A1I6JH20_9GAMM|nr:phospholipase D-like domain-containing protein [Marinobacter daqiaonensis]SFR78276.1 PLD-like domain-containing protein [Marinobacter daqiaonensis]
MDNAQISQYLEERLGGRPVKAAVFTTYTFDPAFFELEVVPLLLPENSSFSIDERVKQFQVRESLREAELPIDVFYDQNIFRIQGESSPGMEYGCHGVSEGNRAFHPKLSFLLVGNGVGESDSLLISAGSNNLTKAGWWDNVECQHWEAIGQRGGDGEFLRVLKRDLEYLQGKQIVQSGNGAVSEIQRFLANCVADPEAPPVHYFGLSSTTRFLDFLSAEISQLKKPVELEIISPFFADNSRNNLHEAFQDLGVGDVRLLLPRDDKQEALCNLDYLAHIDSLENVSWSDWVKTTSDPLGVGKEPHRELHAKIFNFIGADRALTFVGSVNFTYKALNENVEAGFLVATDTESLLEVISDDLPDVSQRSLDPAPGEQHQEAEGVMPQISLTFDWLTKTLSGAVDSESSIEIDLIGADGAGNAAVIGWCLSNVLSDYTGNTEALEKALANGSLILVSGRVCDSDELIAPHRVLLQQTHWSHKPQPELATLSPQQILAIYAGMSPERRQLLLTDARVKRLFELGERGETSLIEEAPLENEFFSEYAELFHAFRMLRRDLSNEQSTPKKQDYYLTGTGVDSLPTLVGRAAAIFESAPEDKQPLHPVSAYLLLLSAKEVYRSDEFTDRPYVSQQLELVESLLQQIRESKLIKLSSEREADREQFFEWFETQFLEQYRTEEAEAGA